MLTGQECERSRRQQALHCGHSGKSGQRGRRVATGLRGYGACEAAEGVVQKSGAKDESSRSGTLTFNRTHASERGAAARKSRVWSRIAGVRKFCRISFHARVQHVCLRCQPEPSAPAPRWLAGSDLHRLDSLSYYRVRTTRPAARSPLTPCHSSHAVGSTLSCARVAPVCRYSSHEPRAGVTAERAAVPRHPADIQSDFEHHPCVINMRRACAAVSVVLCSEMGAVMGVGLGVVLGVVLGVSSLS